MTGPLTDSINMDVANSVSIEAKRILLRYGAPIAVLERVGEAERVQLARVVAKTGLAEREAKVRELLTEHGYLKKS